MMKRNTIVLAVVTLFLIIAVALATFGAKTSKETRKKASEPTTQATSACSRCSTSYTFAKTSYQNASLNCLQDYKPVGEKTYSVDCSCNGADPNGPNYKGAYPGSESCVTSCSHCSTVYKYAKSSWINAVSDCAEYKPVGSKTYSVDCSCNGADPSDPNYKGAYPGSESCQK